jgi:hypothetical protein
MLSMAVAAVGVVIDAVGWSLGSRVVAVIGFFVGAAGVLCGIVLVVLFQIIGIASKIWRNK